MEAFITENLALYGPYAVFFLLMLSGIGLSLSEDLIVIPAGILVGRGDLEFWPILIASYVGVVTADILWFNICYRWGTPLLHKPWFKRMIHPRRLLEVKHQIEQRGSWVIVMARFIPGSRTTTMTVAAMLHMSRLKFAAITAACVTLTAPMQLGAGVLIAKGLSNRDTADMVKWIIGVVMLGVAALLVVRLYRRHKARGERPPRAKMRWLKRFRKQPSNTRTDAVKKRHVNAASLK